MKDKDFLINFSTTKWDTVSYENKLELLQQLENLMAEIQERFPAMNVKGEKMSGLLRERHDESTIYIDDSLIVGDNFDYATKDEIKKSKNFGAMYATIYGGRKVTQDQILFGNYKGSVEVASKTIKLLQRNKIYYEKNHRTTIEKIVNRYQAIERDAHEFAFNQMESFNHIFKNDAAYHGYILAIEIANKRSEEYAKSCPFWNAKDYLNDVDKYISDMGKSKARTLRLLRNPEAVRREEMRNQSNERKERVR